MDSSLFAPGFKATPFWWEQAAPFTVAADLPGEADLVIVGAGLCGLSAAGRALDLGAKPVVLDAGPIAGGASSRSGAMLSSGQKFLISGTAGHLEPPLLEELIAAHEAAFDHVRRLASSGRFGDVFQASGRLFLAAVPGDLARFAGHAGILAERAGVEARVLGPDALRSEIGSAHYHGGLLVERFGGLHPSRLAVGLAHDLQDRGAVLCSHSRVTAVRRDGTGFAVRTAAGTIRARHVLFATNGYTDAALKPVRRGLAPVGSYMIATVPLPPGTVETLMPGLRMYSDTKRNLWYFRPSPDNRRILFGARPGPCPGRPEQAAILLRRFLATVFPSLSEVPLSHAWTGTVGMTRSHLQHLGQRDGSWFAVGCNGSGIAIMPWLGRLAVERMLGERTTPTVFERLPFRRMPNLGGRPWYVPIAAGSYAVMDWLERRRAAL